MNREELNELEKIHLRQAKFPPIEKWAVFCVKTGMVALGLPPKS